MRKETGQNITPPLSLKERRQRYRQEMVNEILSVAREVMQQQGVAALNLNEVARRLGMSGQALAKYFPNKAALYEVLFLMGHRRFQEAEDEIWRTTKPDWERIRQWFERRFSLAVEYPDLYSLVWGASVPGFAPSEAIQEDIHLMISGARRGIGEVIDAGVIDAGIPADRVVDILLAVRHGIIAEHMGKRDLLPPDTDRFHSLIPEILAVFQQAWAPKHKSALPESDRGAFSGVDEEKGAVIE